MKKKKLKLGLNKINVSNLSTIRGGNGSNVVGCVATVSRNFVDLCCPVFGSDECPNTEVTTCQSGHPGCDDGEPSLYCTLTITMAGKQCL